MILVIWVFSLFFLVLVVQSLSCVRPFASPCAAAGQDSLSFTISRSLLKLMSIELVMPSNHLLLCCPFSFCLLSFPASGSFLMSSILSALHIRWPNIGATALASVLPVNNQDWFPLGCTGFISLQSKGLLRVFSNTTVQKHQFFGAQPSLWSNYHIHTWLLEKTIALTIQTFVGKVMSLLFNMLSRFVIAFLPRSRSLLISWLQSPSTVILEPKKTKSVTAFTFYPSICHEVMESCAMTLVFWIEV